MFSMTARCVSFKSLGHSFWHSCYKSAELLLSLILNGSGMSMRLGICAQVLERNTIYVVLKHFIFPKRTVLVHLYKQINIHRANEYAAISNTRNQNISSEQTWQLYITQQGKDEGLKCATSHMPETQTACWIRSNIIISLRNCDLTFWHRSFTFKF